MAEFTSKIACSILAVDPMSTARAPPILYLAVLLTKLHCDTLMTAVTVFVITEPLMMSVCGKPETKRAPPEPTDVQSLKEDNQKVA